MQMPNKTRATSSARIAGLSFILIWLSACDADAPPTDTSSSAAPHRARTVFVQLFEWPWTAVADECETFLGPTGYAAVQVSPANEHVPGPEWWTRYQPVSYRLESRGGTREQFRQMVQRCNDAGVAIYADAIINHMARVGSGKGVAGSEFTEYNYPAVPYSYADFHHCDRYADDAIQNYHDLWEVQNCELAKLADLDTGQPEVQAKIAGYLNDLLSLGVAGFRIDAAKHMSVDDIAGILQQLNAEAHIYQEVIDRGGEPVNAHDYLNNGLVSEFKYPIALLDAFAHGELDGVDNLATRDGFLPADSAVVFIDNHDIQRGHAGASEVLNYKSGKRYELANVFMLAWPYGNPMVMSSYRFDNGDQGPPDTRPIEPGASNCNDAWVCEHRFAAIAGMVEFRNLAAGAAVTDWQALSNTTIAFGRDDRGFVIINVGEDPVSQTFRTSMRPGNYCNATTNCAGDQLKVAEGGTLTTTVPPMSAVAIHANSIAARQ